MNPPKVIADVVKAQVTFDNAPYAACFAETAVVFDEGHTHMGRKEIQQWIADANKKYKTVIKPLDYEANTEVLKAEISGTFPGGRTVLQYHFELKDGLIQSLKITG